jgi:hypothetical protein
MLPAAASGVWLFWLAAEKGVLPIAGGTLTFWAGVALGTTVVTTVAPGSLVLLAVVAFYYLARGAPGNGRRFTALVIVPTAFRLAALLPAAIAEGQASNPGYWFDSTIGPGWSLGPWLGSWGTGAFRSIRTEVNAYFYLPMLGPLAVTAWKYRKCWWFAPTFLWAAALVAGNIVFGRTFSFYESLTLDAALLVPFGLVGIEDMRKARGQRNNRPGPIAAAEKAYTTVEHQG